MWLTCGLQLVLLFEYSILLLFPFQFGLFFTQQQHPAVNAVHCFFVVFYLAWLGITVTLNCFYVFWLCNSYCCCFFVVFCALIRLHLYCCCSCCLFKWFAIVGVTFQFDTKCFSAQFLIKILNFFYFTSTLLATLIW